MAGEPERQVDVEVVAAVFGVPPCHARQRTRPAIEDQDADFEKHERRKNERVVEVSPPGNYRDREDASDEERPGRRVDRFYDAQCGLRAHQRLCARCASTQRRSARTTDVSICLSGIDQYLRSSRSLSLAETTVNPLRR